MAPNLDSLRMRADIQIAQKKWDDAIVTLNKAIALSPRDAQLHGGLGRIYLQKRDFPDALKELKMRFAAGREKSGVLEGSEHVLLSFRRLSRPRLQRWMKLQKWKRLALDHGLFERSATIS